MRLSCGTNDAAANRCVWLAEATLLMIARQANDQTTTAGATTGQQVRQWRS